LVNLTSLLRDLKILLVVLDCLVVSADILESNANLAVRHALAALVS
jgi:hypothetical protein